MWLRNESHSKIPPILIFLGSKSRTQNFLVWDSQSYVLFMLSALIKTFQPKLDSKFSGFFFFKKESWETRNLYILRA